VLKIISLIRKKFIKLAGKLQVKITGYYPLSSGSDGGIGLTGVPEILDKQQAWEDIRISEEKYRKYKESLSDPGKS